MVDDATVAGPSPELRCVWCSAVLPTAHESVCPSCGATLVGEGEAAVPGLTAIDADAILRNARGGRTRPRGGRLLSWISGEYDEGEGEDAATPGSLAPPPAEVRREMLRLELEAQVANAQAEVEALAADAALEEGKPLTPRVEGDSSEAPATSEPATPEPATPEPATLEAAAAHDDESAAPPA